MRNTITQSYPSIAILLANDISCPECGNLSNSVENAESILKEHICLACIQEIKEDHVRADVDDQLRQEALEREQYNFDEDEKFTNLYN